VKKSIILILLTALFFLSGCESEEEKAARLAEIENIQINIAIKTTSKNLINAMGGSYLQTMELENEIRELEYRLSKLQR
jgi:PBP1b-binding outer membrane lipoprotein LpoB